MTDARIAEIQRLVDYQRRPFPGEPRRSMNSLTAYNDAVPELLAEVKRLQDRLWQGAKKIGEITGEPGSFLGAGLTRKLKAAEVFLVAAAIDFQEPVPAGQQPCETQPG